MKIALRISAIYVLVSSLYIILSDRFVLYRYLDSEALNHLSQIQTAKGLIFVIGTGLLIFLLTYRSVRKLEQAKIKKRAFKGFIASVISPFPEGIALLNPKGNKVISNEKLEKLIPHTDDGKNRPFDESILNEEIRKAFVDYFATRKDNEEYTVNTDDDKWVLIKLSKIRIPPDGPYTLIRCEDITQSRNAQLSILYDKEEFLTILEGVPFGIIFFDRTGKLTFGNEMANRLHSDFNPDLSIFKLPKLIHPADSEDFERKLKKAIQLNKPLNLRSRLNPVEHSSPWCQFDLLPVDDDMKKGFLMIIRDISAQVEMEEKHELRSDELKKEVQDRIQEIQLKNAKLEESQQALRDLLKDVEDIRDELIRSNAKLAEANSELEAFTYSVSHDLRAPLRAISGFSEALLEEYSEMMPELGRDYLIRIQKGTEKMSDLIDNMLALSRVSRANFSMAFVNLSDLIAEINREMCNTYPDRIVELKVQQTIWCEGDINMLRILFSNLLGNAWKFTSSREVAEISVACEGDEIYIRDNGVGFDEKYINKIYEPFQRLHNNSQFKGTGIGLTIVKRIIDKHGGGIRVKSAVGEGATFYLKLPKLREIHCENKV